MSRRERRSRVLEYYAARNQQNQEPQPEDETGADPLEGLDAQSFGLIDSGKESENV